MKITVTRVYLVDCSDCGAVTADLGSVLTQAEAARVKREHAEWHAREDGDVPEVAGARLRA